MGKWFRLTGLVDIKLGSYNQPDILQRLNISTENWLILTTQFRTLFHGAVGNSQALADFCQHQQLKKRATVSICKKLLA